MKEACKHRVKEDVWEMNHWSRCHREENNAAKENKNKGRKYFLYWEKLKMWKKKGTISRLTSSTMGEVMESDK